MIRACLLATLVVVSGVAAGAGGSVAAGPEPNHDGSIDRQAAEQLSGHDAVLQDGGRYYVGMVLLRDAGVDTNEDISVFDASGEFVNLELADENGEVLIDTGDDVYEPGEYTLEDEAGNEIATFRLIEQSFSGEFDTGAVDTAGSNTEATVEFGSNRRNFDIDVTATRDDGSTVPPEVLQSLLEGSGRTVDTDDDGDADVLRIAGAPSVEYTWDFRGAEPGIYDFSFDVPDTGVSVTDSITVGSEVSGTAEFPAGRSQLTDHRGDVPEIGIELDETDRATVTIGTAAVNYELEATVQDRNDDGEVVLRWNTDRAGRDPAQQVVSAVGSDRVSSATRIRGDLRPGRRLSAAVYPLELSVGGSETDSGEISLVSPDRVPRSVATLTAARDTDRDDVVDSAAGTSVVSVGDFLVIQLQAAGIHAAIQSRTDLINDRDGISVSVRETAESAGNEPRTRIDLDTFRFESRASNDQLYLFASTEVGDFEAGDTYRVTFEIDGSDNPYVEDTISRTATVTLAAQEVSIDTGMGDLLRVQPDSQRVCGASTLPQGRQVTLELRSVGGGTTLSETVSATVDADGRFCAELDFSPADPGQEFRVTVVLNGDEVATADGQVVQRGSVSIADQRPPEGQIVDVESARLPNGGFVVIERASDGAILGWSRPLSPGSHEDVTVTLESAIDSRTEVRAVIYQNNGRGTFDQTGRIDPPYEFEGSVIADTAVLRVESTTTTTTTSTTTTSTTTTTTTTTTRSPTTTTSTTSTTTTGEDDGDDGDRRAGHGPFAGAHPTASNLIPAVQTGARWTTRRYSSTWTTRSTRTRRATRRGKTPPGGPLANWATTWTARSSRPCTRRGAVT